jgi:hypothetical protein
MKIANASTHLASLVAIGVLLTPFAAEAQEDTAPPAGETPDSVEAPAAAEPSAPNEAGAADDAAADAAAPAEEPARPEAEPAQPAAPPADVERDSIVVTGYRKSLKAALSKKKKSTGQVDAIVAEDMAEFPDLNLAESLQRMPGVAIERARPYR